MFNFLCKNKIDLIYIEGPGDIVESLTRWHEKEDLISETSLTFSGQVFDFCEKNNLKALATSSFPEAKQVEFGNISAYSKPRATLSGSIGYHISQIVNGLRILGIVVRHRPKYLHVTSGVAHWFSLVPIKLLGVKIFPHLHNTLWPKGYPPTSKTKCLLLKLDTFFFKNIATSILCCSPEIQRQVEKITIHKSCPIYQFKPQFYLNSTKNQELAPEHSQKPFVVVFAGRVEYNKGVFDLLDIAEKLSNENIFFHICGGGSALETLKNDCLHRNLSGFVKIHGRLNRPDLLKVYSQSHVVIIPTRSDFAEGFAMVAAEAILLNRPIITSKIVPALELLSSASLEAEANNVSSYIQAIQRLVIDKNLYTRLSLATQPLREQFLDRKQGLTNILEKTL